jgi:hypothetical protein
MRWATHERPKIDRLASPWLIRRFVDREAEFLFLPPTEIRKLAVAGEAIPFDVHGTPEAELVHGPGETTFDVIRQKFHLYDAALDRVGAVIRDADNDNAFRRVPEAAGLRAISLGLAESLRDDQQRLAHAMVMYDALYEWASRIAAEEAVFARAPRLYRAWCAIDEWMGSIRERRIVRELDRFGLGKPYPKRSGRDSGERP